MHVRLLFIGFSQRQVCRYPVPDGRHASVNARKAGSSASVSPAGHPGDKPLARELLADQWTPRVSLEEGEERRNKPI